MDVVDTPGTNDLNVGRIEITYRYLRQAEAAILVLTATQPLTRTEKEFLVEQVVGNNIKDIFIVINYKDEVLGAEDRVVKHVLGNLADVQDFSQRIFHENKAHGRADYTQPEGAAREQADVYRAVGRFDGEQNQAGGSRCYRRLCWQYQ